MNELMNEFKLILCLNIPLFLRFFKPEVLNHIQNLENSKFLFLTFSWGFDKKLNFVMKQNAKHIWKWQPYLTIEEFNALLIQTQILYLDSFFVQCTKEQLVYVFKYLVDFIPVYNLGRILKIHSFQPFLPDECFLYISKYIVTLSNQASNMVSKRLCEIFFETAPQVYKDSLYFINALVKDF